MGDGEKQDREEKVIGDAHLGVHMRACVCACVCVALINPIEKNVERMMFDSLSLPLSLSFSHTLHKGYIRTEKECRIFPPFLCDSIDEQQHLVRTRRLLPLPLFPIIRQREKLV